MPQRQAHLDRGPPSPWDQVQRLARQFHSKSLSYSGDGLPAATSRAVLIGLQDTGTCLVSIATFLAETTACLKEAIALKERKAQLEPQQYHRQCSEIEQRLAKLLHTYAEIEDEDAARFVARLTKQRKHLLTFLYHEQVPATSNQAERMIRPEVVARKTQGCSKSTAGADAHAVLGSILVSEKQRGNSPVERLVHIARRRTPPHCPAPPSFRPPCPTHPTAQPGPTAASTTPQNSSAGNTCLWSRARAQTRTTPGYRRRPRPVPTPRWRCCDGCVPAASRSEHRRYGCHRFEAEPNPPKQAASRSLVSPRLSPSPTNCQYAPRPTTTGRIPPLPRRDSPDLAMPALCRSAQH